MCIRDRYKGVDDVSSAIDDALMSVYVNHPEYVVNTESDLSKKMCIRDRSLDHFVR